MSLDNEDMFREIYNIVLNTNCKQIDWLCNEQELDKYFFYDKRRTKACPITPDRYLFLINTCMEQFGKSIDSHLIVKHMIMIYKNQMTLEGVQKWASMQPRSVEEIEAILIKG